MASFTFISLISAGLLLFVAAGCLILFDFMRSRRDRQGREVVWYRSPRTFLGVCGIGLSQFVWMIAFYRLNALLPDFIYITSLLSIMFIGSCYALFSGLRNAHKHYRAGVSLNWYRHPKLLKQMAWVALCFGLLFVEGALSYATFQRFLHSSYHPNFDVIYFVLTSSFGLSFVLYIYAFIRQVIEVYKGTRPKKSSNE